MHVAFSEWTWVIVVHCSFLDFLYPITHAPMPMNHGILLAKDSWGALLQDSLLHPI